MTIFIWITVVLFFGSIFRSIWLEMKYPTPEPKKEIPPPPVFNTHIQINNHEHYHQNTHNEMKVTIIKAEPTENKR